MSRQDLISSTEGSPQWRRSSQAVCEAEEDGDAGTHCCSDAGNLLLTSFDSVLDEGETNTLYYCVTVHLPKETAVVG